MEAVGGDRFGVEMFCSIVGWTWVGGAHEQIHQTICQPSCHGAVVSAGGRDRRLSSAFLDAAGFQNWRYPDGTTISSVVGLMYS